MTLRISCVLVGFLSLVLSMAAQNSGSPASAQVPPLIQFSNVATDEGGNSLSGVVSIAFSLYNGQQGGEPLWTETQNNVQLDSTGHYSVQLGITKPAGVSTALFTSGQARWLGVRITEQAEQPRVLLVSVPYALKAGDAATVGGLPPSAFLLAAPQNGAASVAATESASEQSVPPPSSPVTGTGTVNFVPLWDTTSDIVSSVIFQSGTGSTAKIGINTTTPASTLDVKGGGTIRGTLNLPSAGVATATKGANSQSLNLAASAFNSSTVKAVTQTFQWQAEPAGNDTSSPSGTLNLLFGSGTSKPTETGLNIASNGQIKFATGQTFPGTGDGTVTSVGSGLGLTGGPITGSGTLAIDTSVVPQLGASSNTFAGNQVVNGNVTASNVTATGTVTGTTVTGAVVNATTSFDLGGSAFAFGSVGNQNAFLGFAGNSSTSGQDNTAIGYQALVSNTGSFNTASGSSALQQNTTGNFNTASGSSALLSNTSGTENTASGVAALQSNTTGSFNTASGSNALQLNTVGGSNTASGSNALQLNTVGGSNTASGVDALYANTTGGNNTATGAVALSANTTGGNNTATGQAALFQNTTGSNNTAVGYRAGVDPTFSFPTTGSNSTFLGVSASTTVDGLNNATAIGAYASAAASNSLVLGAPAGAGSGAITANTNVGIDVGNPSNIFTVLKGGGHAIADGWDTYSSRRWKTNIQPLQNALGMVNRMRGVSYDLKDSGKHEIGVIAEEIGEVVPEVVSYEENGKDARGVDYSRLTALLIEATKEQQREIQHQQAVLRTQVAAIRDLKSELRATRQTLQKVKAQVAAAQPALVAAK
jgi:endosialidase-like protein